VSSVDLHPEDLFDRARRGEASERDVERFQAHLEQCRACRFEYTLALECAEGSTVLPGDELVVARIRQATARSLERCSESSALAERARDRMRSRLLLVAVAAVFSLAGIMLTQALLAPAFRFPRPSFLRRAAVAQLFKENAAEGPATASLLFAKANVAQRDGAASDAARLYTELERSFPGAPEELVARVLLGRLLLDRLDDARAALAQFDSYLANPDHDALGEEALIGRALALERLGRHGEERSAWEVLLGAYPRSSYAEPARTRLDELR
jgi:tetratricopeptide (TPR) repeat protein